MRAAATKRGLRDLRIELSVSTAARVFASVRGGVAEDVNARLREPFQIWIAPADLPYVQSIRDAFGLTAIDDLGKPLPDRLMSPESSTRTVHDLSPWAALSIKFAGLLTALGGAVTGVDPRRRRCGCRFALLGLQRRRRPV
jgi:hypothetical protein